MAARPVLVYRFEYAAGFLTPAGIQSFVISTWTSATVAARGRRYGALDGCRFAYREDGERVTWLITTTTGDTVTISEGDEPSVAVNGVVVSEDLIPRPWGLLMAAKAPEAHLMDAVPGSIRRHALSAEREQVTFRTPVVDVTLIVHRKSWVVRKTVRAAGELIDAYELSAIEQSG